MATKCLRFVIAATFPDVPREALLDASQCPDRKVLAGVRGDDGLAAAWTSHNHMSAATTNLHAARSPRSPKDILLVNRRAR